MTLADWRDKKSYYHQEYLYHLRWKVRYDDENEGRLADMYYQKYNKMCEYENKILEKVIKTLDKSNFQ